MAPPNNPNIARVTYQFHRDTRVLNNTFHLYRTGGWTYANLVASLSAAYTLWSTFYRQCVPNVVSLYNIHGIVYDPTGSPWVADRNVAPEEVGTRGVNAEAANVTLTVSERTPYAGRAYRGRIYVPGLLEGDVTQADQATSTIVTLLANFAAQWLLTFNSGLASGALAIFHRNDNLFSAVTTTVIENLLDSQRRRLPGRGR